jgi:hypothetical protein
MVAMPVPELHENPARALLDTVDAAFATGGSMEQREALTRALEYAFQMIETLEARLAEVEAHQRSVGRPRRDIDDENDVA